MKIVVTAGGTSEPIDKVRKITNMSKGTLGYKVAADLVLNEEVNTVFLLSPLAPPWKSPKLTWIETTSTKDVHDKLHTVLTTEDIHAVVHSMAVSDYTVDYLYTVEDLVNNIFDFLREHDDKNYPEDVIEHILNGDGDFKLDNSSKVSSKSDNLCIKLKPTEKIISKIKEWAPDTLLMGFKLLENVTTEKLIEVGMGVMTKNSCDYVFANDIKKIRESGHQGYLINAQGFSSEHKGLANVSSAIVTTVLNHGK